MIWCSQDVQRWLLSVDSAAVDWCGWYQLSVVISWSQSQHCCTGAHWVTNIETKLSQCLKSNFIDNLSTLSPPQTIWLLQSVFHNVVFTVWYYIFIWLCLREWVEWHLGQTWSWSCSTGVHCPLTIDIDNCHSQWRDSKQYKLQCFSFLLHSEQS